MLMQKAKLAARCLLSVLWMPVLSQAQTAVIVTDHVRAELVAHAPDGVEAGKQVMLGLAITHQAHWHTYWKNPGRLGTANYFHVDPASRLRCWRYRMANAAAVA